MAKVIKRKRYLVDARLQGTVALRVVMYWLGCMSLATVALVTWRTLTGPARMFYTHLDDIWFQYGALYVILLSFLPLFVIDSIRMSNRFAGPVYRLRRAFQDLAAGKEVAPIHFRDTDFWQEVAADFNAAMAQQAATRAAAQPTSEQPQEPVAC